MAVEAATFDVGTENQVALGSVIEPSLNMVYPPHRLSLKKMIMRGFSAQLPTMMIYFLSMTSL